jgi:hypothetical protein
MSVSQSRACFGPAGARVQPPGRPEGSGLPEAGRGSLGGGRQATPLPLLTSRTSRPPASQFWLAGAAVSVTTRNSDTFDDQMDESEFRGRS